MYSGCQFHIYIQDNQNVHEYDNDEYDDNVSDVSDDDNPWLRPISLMSA